MNREFPEEIDDFSAFEKKQKQDSKPDVQEEAEEVAYRADSKLDKTKKILPKVIIPVVVAIVVVLGGLLAYGASLPKDRIISGLKIGGVEVGGLTATQALAEMENAGSIINSKVIINANGKKYTVLPEDIEVNLDIVASVDKAYATAKSGNPISDAITALKLKFSGNEFMPVISYNEEKFANKINEIGMQVIGANLSEHALRVDESGRVFIVPGVAGYNNDPSAVMSQVDRALLEADSNVIEVNFELTQPKTMTMELLRTLVNSEPVDASFALENGKVVVLPSQDGRKIDESKCRGIVSKIRVGGDEVEIPVELTPAKVHSRELETKLFNGKLASYTTRYAAGGNRGSNVANAASKVNGTILLPGDVFSFNGTVGRRTVANGFKTAPEYMNGQTVDGIGGGTCQVSTTVYSAALYADLKIVKRSNHSMSVSYVPLGQDATVTDGGIDLKIANDTGYPVKIEAVTGGGKITVTIIGTTPEPAKTVKISHSRIPAATGSAVRTTRYVYDGVGNVIKQEDMGVSRYKPHTEAGEASPSPSATAGADPEESAQPGEATQEPLPEGTTVPGETVAPTQKPQPTQAPTKAPETDADKTPVKSDTEE